jgi:hypothetical protein
VIRLIVAPRPSLGIEGAISVIRLIVAPPFWVGIEGAFL